MKMELREYAGNPEGTLKALFDCDIFTVEGEEVYCYKHLEKGKFCVQRMIRLHELNQFESIALGGVHTLEMREYYKSFSLHPWRTYKNTLCALITNTTITVPTFPANKIQEMRLFGDDQYRNGARLAFRMKYTISTFTEFEAWYKEREEGKWL